MNTDELQFRTGGAKGPVVCRGLAVGDNAMTVEHCLKQARSSTQLRTLTFRGEAIALDREKLKALTKNGFSSRFGGQILDFAVFSLKTLGPPDPVPDLLAQIAAPILDAPLVVSGPDGKEAQCKVVARCGNYISYTCGETKPLPGWSGSAVWTNTKPRKLLGFHVGPDDKNDHKAALAQSVLGRSSALFISSENFSKLVAREKRFQFQWDNECAVRQRSTSSDSDVTIDQPILSQGIMHGLSKLEDGRLLGADIANRTLCTLSATDSWTRWTCSKNSAPTANRINKILPLGGDTFAAAEAQLDKNDFPALDDNERAGSISIISVKASGQSLSIIPGRRIISSVGGVYVLKNAGNEIVVGGDDGVCIVGTMRTSCEKICDVSGCQRDGDYRVNGVAVLSPTSFIAVGYDYGEAVPAFRLYRRDSRGWTQTNVGFLGAEIRASVNRLVNRRNGLQLKAPVVVQGKTIVFGSDGAAYEVIGANIKRRVPIEGLWDDASTDQASTQLEDSVRDAVVLRNGMIAVSSSDGCIRLLTVEPKVGGSWVLKASLKRTVFNRGIWITELEPLGNSLFARAQDGTLSRIDLSKLL